MSYTITIGPWIIPLAATAGSLAWAIPLREDERNQGGMFGGLAALPAVFRTGVAVIFSLTCWLTWALVR